MFVWCSESDNSKPTPVEKDQAYRKIDEKNAVLILKYSVVTVEPNSQTPILIEPIKKGDLPEEDEE